MRGLEMKIGLVLSRFIYTVQFATVRKLDCNNIQYSKWYCTVQYHFAIGLSFTCTVHEYAGLDIRELVKEKLVFFFRVTSTVVLYIRNGSFKTI